MGAAVAEIVRWLDDLLDVELYEDHGPNGLQVPGGERVERVVTGVSGQVELFERAAGAGAELVLVHHGILWELQPRRITPALAARLRPLLTRDIALAQYHLPLDAHPVHGNNALLADGLGCPREGRTPFGRHRGRFIGVAAPLPDGGLSATELVERIGALTGRQPLAFPAGPEPVRSIGIVSGAGHASLGEAIDRGLDAFLTGEPAEHVMAEAREAGIHFIAAGHYATETLGIRRLGDLVAERFGVDHLWIDIPNPI